jgi:hypothetical protein
MNVEPCGVLVLAGLSPHDDARIYPMGWNFPDAQETRHGTLEPIFHFSNLLTHSGFGIGIGSEKETHIGSPAYMKIIIPYSTVGFRSLLPRDSESEYDDSDDSDNDNNNCQGDFTSFDVWCAGLSPNTFKDIGGDLATLDDETKAARINVGGRRWQ